MKLKLSHVISFLVGIFSTFLILFFIFGNVIPYYIYYKGIVSLYDGEIDQSVMQESIFTGITSGLGDPHSMYFAPVDADSFLSSLETNHKGIGILYQNVDGDMVVSDKLENTPAWDVDLYPGDVIKAINGTEIDDETIKQPTALFYSDEVSEVEVYRPSTDKTFNIEIQADDFISNTVSYELVQNTDIPVGYIKIDSFSDNTDEEFEEALEYLESQDIEKLIIDVRENGGGNLDTVINICNMLVYSDKPFLSTKIGDKVIDEEYSKLDEPKDYEMYVLQNQNSASASEILSAAIGQAGGGTIIGTTSYGKGSVQTFFDLPLIEGSAKITYAHWYTPNDENIDDNGITPDIEIDPSAFDYLVFSPIALDKNLELGDSTLNVMKMNNFLTILGYQTGFNKIIFDETSLKALHEFQDDFNIQRSDNLDYKSAYKLYQEAMKHIVDPNIDPYIKAAIN